jgi:hypothetical protein
MGHRAAGLEGKDWRWRRMPRRVVRCSTPYNADAASVTGLAAVLVQTKDEAAKAWHLRRAKFMAFPEDRRVLWLPVETVVWAVL